MKSNRTSTRIPKLTRESIFGLTSAAFKATGNMDYALWEMSDATAQLVVKEPSLEGGLGKKWNWGPRKPTKMAGYCGLRNDDLPAGIIYLVVPGLRGKTHFEGVLRVYA